MSCTHITEIIPLYVGNDLDDAETERVTKHLLSCDPCRSLESQYRESSAWLKNVAMADVETDSFPTLRARVSRRINSANRFRRSKAPLRIAAFIAAAAALLIASTLSLYLRAASTKSVPEVAISKARVEVGHAVELVRPIRRSARSRQRLLPIVSNPSVTLLPTVPVAPVPHLSSQLAKLPTFPSTSPVENSVRIEIQTADPTIRIIWLPSESGGLE
jgi:anti-sigma factor RsiW